MAGGALHAVWVVAARAAHLRVAGRGGYGLRRGDGPPLAGFERRLVEDSRTGERGGLDAVTDAGMASHTRPSTPVALVVEAGDLRVDTAGGVASGAASVRHLRTTREPRVVEEVRPDFLERDGLVRDA
ncbi:MAG: hypothetical protein N3B11_07790 [Coriobacteriia bacterium]|nr:hypothetical protein [Coriobacteriia bacterium]